VNEVITIGNLEIKQYCKDDLENLLKVADNPKVARWLSDVFPSPYTREDGEWWINHCLEQSPQRDFAITKDDRVIGGIGAIAMAGEYRLTGEVGYWIGEEYWGQGILPTVLPLFVKWMFDEFGLERIEAPVFAPNIGSARVLEKSGFTFEGTQRNRVVKNGEVLDAKSYSILKDEVN